MTDRTELLDLRSRTALVTGAGQGVGRQIAVHFATHGAGAVVINDLVAERAESVAAEVEALGVKALPIAADITDRSQVANMCEDAAGIVGGVDIVVNNAGVVPGPRSLKKFEDSSPEEWEPWINLNLHGVMLVTRAVLPAMLENRWGRVITIVSDAGRTGLPRMAAYGAAKAGAAGFSRCLALEVAKRGVTVNCVALGGIRTEQQLAAMSAEELAKAESHYPLGRFGEPEEAANAVLFLASQAADWITGQVYPVNGGYSFGM